VDYGASLVVRAQRLSGQAVEEQGSLVDGRKIDVLEQNIGIKGGCPG
jgi:hypothetical protein